MINYVDKPGLSDAIRLAGHALREENGVMTSSDDAAVQAIIDAYSLADAAAARCLEIDAHAVGLRDKAVRGIAVGEMASWPIKRAEALAVAAGGSAAAAPMLAAEAAGRGVALTAIVDRVLANAAGLATLEAAIAGACGRHKDAVRALGAFADIAAYDWSAGWPVV